jgi:hypothetical protein
VHRRLTRRAGKPSLGPSPMSCLAPPECQLGRLGRHVKFPEVSCASAAGVRLFYFLCSGAGSGAGFLESEESIGSSIKPWSSQWIILLDLRFDPTVSGERLEGTSGCD